MADNLTTINVTAQLETAQAVSGLGQMSKALEGLSEKAKKINELWKVIVATATKLDDLIVAVVKGGSAWTKLTAVVSRVGVALRAFLPWAARVTPILGPIVNVLSIVSLGFSAVQAAVEKVTGSFKIFTDGYTKAKAGLVDLGEAIKTKVAGAIEAARGPLESLFKKGAAPVAASAAAAPVDPAIQTATARAAEFTKKLEEARAKLEQVKAAGADPKIIAYQENQVQHYQTVLGYEQKLIDRLKQEHALRAATASATSGGASGGGGGGGIMAAIKAKISAISAGLGSAAASFSAQLNSAVGSFSAGLGAKLNQLAEGIRKVRENSQQMTSEMASGSVAAAGGVAKMAGAFRGLSTAAKAFAATGIGAIITAFVTIVRLIPNATAQYGEFETSMLHTKALMQESGKLSEASFQAMGKEARRLGATTTFTASQAADGMRYLAGSGFTAKQAVDSLEGTLYLAQAGNIGLAESARIVSANINAFGVSAKETGRFVDVLAVVSAKSNATVTTMGESFRYSAAAAASLGIPMEQMAVALGMLGRKSQTGSMVGTGLAQMMYKLSDPSSKAIKELNKLGLSFSDVNPQANKMSDVLRKMAAAQIDGTNIARIFGANTARTALNLLEAARMTDGNVSALDDMEKAIEGANGSAKRMADTMMSRYHGAVKMMSSAWEELNLTIAESGAIQVKTWALRKMADMVNWVSSSIKFLRDELTQQPKEWFADALKYGAAIGVNYLVGGLVYAGQVLQNILGVIGHSLLAMIMYSVSWLLQKTSGFVAPILAAFQVMGSWLAIWGKMIWEAVNTGFIIPFKGAMVAVMTWIHQTWVTIRENFVNPLQDAMVSIFTWIGDKFAKIANLFVDKFRKVGKWLGFGDDEKEKEDPEEKMTFGEKVKAALTGLRAAAVGWGSATTKQWEEAKKKMEESIARASAKAGIQGNIHEGTADFMSDLASKVKFDPNMIFDRDKMDELADEVIGGWKSKPPEPMDDENPEFKKPPEKPVGRTPDLAFGGDVAKDINIIMGRTANEIIASNTNMMIERMDEQIDMQGAMNDRLERIEQHTAAPPPVNLDLGGVFRKKK